MTISRRLAAVAALLAMLFVGSTAQAALQQEQSQAFISKFAGRCLDAAYDDLGSNGTPVVW
ncbi:hypothetical protein [Allorhizocola rhizosphaerae]|uniref:hypothetical protein n=1 Tax=Allorhizocola rhizosphaerae TaxID=1872709 RepID=UPI000E3C2328|nr:hypothetical protein [Allorhizocola rhizosphaerae]